MGHVTIYTALSTGFTLSGDIWAKHVSQLGPREIPQLKKCHRLHILGERGGTDTEIVPANSPIPTLQAESFPGMQMAYIKQPSTRPLAHQIFQADRKDWALQRLILGTGFSLCLSL